MYQKPLSQEIKSFGGAEKKEKFVHSPFTIYLNSIMIPTLTTQEWLNVEHWTIPLNPLYILMLLGSINWNQHSLVLVSKYIYFHILRALNFTHNIIK